MIETINRASEFRDIFMRYGRHNSFSYEGFEVLFDFLEEIDPMMEVDPIAIDCDFVESDIPTILADYDLSSVDELRERTTVLEVDEDTVIYQVF